MEALISWLALVLSVIVAIVQFSGNRPVIDIEPDERRQDPDDWDFILRVRNGTPSAIQIRRYRFWFSKSKLIAYGKVSDGLVQCMTGTVNLWIEAGQKVELALKVEKGKRLFLILQWRRLSGLHLTSRLPLYVEMSPGELDQLKHAQTQVQPLRA